MTGKVLDIVTDFVFKKTIRICEKGNTFERKYVYHALTPIFILLSEYQYRGESHDLATHSCEARQL